MPGFNYLFNDVNAALQRSLFKGSRGLVLTSTECSPVPWEFHAQPQAGNGAPSPVFGHLGALLSSQRSRTRGWISGFPWDSPGASWQSFRLTAPSSKVVTSFLLIDFFPWCLIFQQVLGSLHRVWRQRGFSPVLYLGWFILKCICFT